MKFHLCENENFLMCSLQLAIFGDIYIPFIYTFGCSGELEKQL